MQHRRLLSAFALVLLASCSGLRAQQTPPVVPQPTAGGNRERVKALPAHIKVHITTDHGGKTCRVFAVSDDTLTCSKRGNTAGTVLTRAEIRHIRLTHHVRSTLVGAGIGGGIGAIAGGLATRGDGCKAGQGLCFDIVTPTDVAVVSGVGVGLVGSLLGSLTDLVRGSSIYTRPWIIEG